MNESTVNENNENDVGAVVSFLQNLALGGMSLEDRAHEAYLYALDLTRFRGYRYASINGLFRDNFEAYPTLPRHRSVAAEVLAKATERLSSSLGSTKPTTQQ
jgi:hypothetical protein